MATQIKLGNEAKLYYGPAGSSAGTSNEFTIIRNATLNLSADEVDITDRNSANWKGFMAGLLDASVDIEINNDSSDGGYQDLRAAFIGRTAIALLILDEESGEGLDADFIVTGFTRNEQAAQAQTVSITVRPYNQDREPTWQTSSGS